MNFMLSKRIEAHIEDKYLEILNWRSSNFKCRDAVRKLLSYFPLGSKFSRESIYFGILDISKKSLNFSCKSCNFLCMFPSRFILWIDCPAYETQDTFTIIFLFIKKILQNIRFNSFNASLTFIRIGIIFRAIFYLFLNRQFQTNDFFN